MGGQLKEFLQRWVITTVAVLVAAHLVGGIHYDRVAALLAGSFFLGFLNAFLRPLLLLLALPLLLLTLGVIFFFINAGLLFFVGRIIPGFHVDDFRAAFWGGLVISVVSTILNAVTGRVQVRWGRVRPPSDPPNDGGGPTIDI